MKNKFFYFIMLSIIIYSCKTIAIENKKAYKRINEKNIITNTDDCKNVIYINKKTKQKLNGKFKINRDYETIYASFADGLFNGKYENVYKFDHDLYHIKSHFIKGNKYGTEEEYINNKLHRKCNYVNNVKQGKEYYFDKKNGDTLDVITYYYDPNYIKPYFYKLYFSDTKDQNNWKIETHYKNSIFLGKLKLQGKYHYTQYSEQFFNSNNLFEFPYSCKSVSCIVEINNIYFLGISYHALDLYLYKLEKEP